MQLQVSTLGYPFVALMAKMGVHGSAWKISFIRERGIFMGVMITIASLVSAIATTVIAIYIYKSLALADKNHQLAQEIKNANEIIAIYANKNHKLADKNFELAQEIKFANELKNKGDDAFRQQVKDFCEAIVISNLLYSDKGLDRRLALFERTYQGKTPISIKSRKNIN
jgi:hypothetical protein